MIRKQAMQETKALQAVHQATAEELKQQVMEIGFKIQEQAQKTLLQEQNVKEVQEKATECFA